MSKLIFGLSVLALITLLSGCAATKRMYSGSQLPAEKIATIERGEMSLALVEINGEKHGNSKDYFIMHKKIELLPGKHKLGVHYDDGDLMTVFNEYLTLEAEAGKNYLIKSEEKNGKIFVGIVEKN